MQDFIRNSAFFGVSLSFAAYGLGLLINKKLRSPFTNPLLMSTITVMAVLYVTGTDYQTYNKGMDVVTYMLTPATVCLAIPLYEQLELLKRDYKAILAGITAGVLASLCIIFVMSLAFGLGHVHYVSLMPKSITTAIGISLSEEMGGIVPLTVAMIIVTGMAGNILGEMACRWFGIEEPIAKGVALGTSAHVIGTARAIQMGKIEGAVSGLSIAVAGLLTVVFSMFFGQLI